MPAEQSTPSSGLGHSWDKLSPAVEMPPAHPLLLPCRKILPKPPIPPIIQKENLQSPVHFAGWVKGFAWP